LYTLTGAVGETNQCLPGVPGMCDEHADCEQITTRVCDCNPASSYRCDCRAGYDGNGKTCTGKSKQRAADHGKRTEREPKGGSRASLKEGLGRSPAPARAEPLVGGGSGREAKPPEAESFFFIFIQKKWPKFKDLNENLFQGLGRLLRAATTSPKFWSILLGERPNINVKNVTV